MKKKGSFDALTTELPGVTMRVEPGVEVNIPLKIMKAFYRLAKQFATAYFRIRNLADQQSKRRDKIIEMAKKYEGLRGLFSEQDNFILTVIPRKKVSWVRDLLKKSLGGVYPAVVREELVVRILIPPSFAGEIIREAIREALIDHGFTPEDLDKLMRQEVEIHPDEEKIAVMVKQGQVQLLAGAKTTEITWMVDVDRLKK